MQKAACDRYFSDTFVKFMAYNEKALVDGGGTWFVGNKVCTFALRFTLKTSSDELGGLDDC